MPPEPPGWLLFIKILFLISRVEEAAAEIADVPNVLPFPVADK